MTKARYIFWDSDNTLTANGDLHWRKHRSTAARHGVIIAPEHQRRIYENNGSQNWEWLSAQLSLAVPHDQYLDEIDRWYAAHVHEIEFRPGILMALDLFAFAGAHQCVVSNGRRNSVMLALDAKRIADRFEFILCKEDYTGRKPDAAPYLAALERMARTVGHQIEPADCLAIEDDPLGVTSAHAAGLAVIHRRLHEHDPVAPEAAASVYSGLDFLEACKTFI